MIELATSSRDDFILDESEKGILELKGLKNIGEK